MYGIWQNHASALETLPNFETCARLSWLVEPIPPTLLFLHRADASMRLNSFSSNLLAVNPLFLIHFNRITTTLDIAADKEPSEVSTALSCINKATCSDWYIVILYRFSSTGSFCVKSRLQFNHRQKRAFR